MNLVHRHKWICQPTYTVRGKR